jgi:hypothetical protein
MKTQSRILSSIRDIWREIIRPFTGETDCPDCLDLRERTGIARARCGYCWRDGEG